MTGRLAAVALAACLAGQAPAWAQQAPEGIVAPGVADAQPWPPAGATLLGDLVADDGVAWVRLRPAEGDPTPPTTSRGKWYTAAERTLIACHAFDTAYTQRLIGTGRFHEATPLLGHFQDPGLFVGFKFGVAFGQLKADRIVARSGHPVLAAVMNAAAGGVMCGAAVHNARLYREDQGQ